MNCNRNYISEDYANNLQISSSFHGNIFNENNEINMNVTVDPSQLHVLVVDDSTAIQKVMKRWLESNGCSVTIAENGKLGLALLKERRFDIAFIDFLMVITIYNFLRNILH